MTRPKVLVLSHMYPRQNSPMRGVFIHHHVQHLISSGCESIVVSPVPYAPGLLATNERRRGYGRTPTQDVIDAVNIYYPRYLRPPGERFHAFSTVAMSIGGVDRAISALLRDWRPDLLHVHTATPAGYAGLRIGRRHGLPVVVSLRGSDINIYPFRDRWTMKLTRKVLSEADRVLAVSNELAVVASTIATPLKPIETVYTGCDLDEFSFDAEARTTIRQRLCIPVGSVVLAFVGNLLKEKGADELMAAFCTLVKRGMDELQIVIVGAGVHQKEMMAAAENGGTGDKAHFVEQVPHKEIPAWLSASDIVVLPSWHEGLPNAIVEAMACERPVVATRVGGIPEVVEDGVSGVLVDRRDVRALTEAIGELVSDATKRRTMGHAGRRIVEQRFSWQENAEKTIKVYEEVLNAS